MLSEPIWSLVCQYEFQSLPNKKVSSAKDHGKNYIKVRLRLFQIIQLYHYLWMLSEAI